MLSRVLQSPAVDAKPFVLRGPAPPVQRAMRPVSASGERDEFAILQSKIGQLTSEVDKQSKQAFEAGLRAGEAAATERLEGEVRATVAQMAATIAQLASLRAETIHRAEADTVRLAIEIARRVLHRELTVDTSALGALIKAALEKLQTQEVYRVRVHPDQATIVRHCLDEIGRSAAVEVLHDPAQPRGGAVFEIARGALDASVDTQLREIESGLIDHMEARN